MDGSKNDLGDTQGLPLDELEGLFEDTFNQLAEDAKRLTETKLQNNPLNTPLFEPNLKPINQEILEDIKTPEIKAKTSLRMKYEAEVMAFIKREGSLEDIRRKLGLSKRKIGQLLLVDPSAWTRWTKSDGDAPPHIYRALEWFLLLQEKHPEYKSTLWLNAVSRPQLSKHEINTIKEELISSSKDEITKKAIFYIQEEDAKRNKLKSEVKEKINSISSLKRWIYALVACQLLMTLLFIYISL